MADGQQQAPKKRKSTLDKLREGALPRTQRNYEGLFAPTPSGSAAEVAQLPSLDEHSSQNEQTTNTIAHEHSSQNEHSLSNNVEQALSDPIEQPKTETSPILTEAHVRSSLTRHNISSKYVDVFAFILHFTSTNPDSRVGKMLYQRYIEDVSYITIRRALDFWEQILALRVKHRDTLGTIWEVDPVFTKVLREYFVFRTYPPIDPEMFRSGLQFRKTLAIRASTKSVKNEQTNEALLDRENKNLNNLSISYNLDNVELSEYWPNLCRVGFTKSHLKQIEDAFRAQCFELTNIPMFMRFIEYELEHGTCKDKNGKEVEKPISWFLVCMKKGSYRMPDGYIDPRAYADHMRLKEEKDNIEREAELKFLANKEKRDYMLKMVELLQDELAQNGIHSPNLAFAKKICGPAFDLVARQGTDAWKHPMLGAAFRTACTKEMMVIDLINDKPVIKMLSDANVAGKS